MLLINSERIQFKMFSPNHDSSLSLTVPPYRNEEQFESLCQVSNMMRQSGLLCDVVIKAGDKEIKAHRLILASCSPYFYAMFTTELSESKQEKVVLKEMDSSALQLLIDYCYTAEIQVTENVVQALLPAACLLQLNDVKDACCDFLRMQLHPTNCLGIRAFADLHSCGGLVAAAHAYVEQHFSEVMLSEEFLQLTEKQVIEIVASDKLMVTSEHKVFEAVISWVKYNKVEREIHLPALMEHVRLPLLSRDYLVERVETEPLIKLSFACKDYLIEAMKYHLMPPSHRAAVQTPRTRTRTPLGGHRCMYVVGGQAPKAIRGVEYYDFVTQRWQIAADMNSRRCRAGVSAINGLIYAVGGFNGSLRVRSVDCFDSSRNEWQTVASMEARRSTLGAAVMNGLLYAVGGFDGTTGLNSCECYDPKVNEWRSVQPMVVRRSSVGVGVLKGYLYAIGGYDGASRQCLTSVERYDPLSNEWSFVADMGVKRSGAGIGVLNSCIYAVGGHDGPQVRRSIEYYDPEKNIWTSVADMTMARRNAGVAVVDNLLYVVGGDDGTNNLNTVEVYDYVCDQWSIIPAQMSTGRSYAGVAVIEVEAAS